MESPIGERCRTPMTDRPIVNPPTRIITRVVAEELSPQKEKWRLGQGETLEYYANAYPELGEVAQLPVPLIFAEYHARQLYGDHPVAGIYKSRFPAQYAEFARVQQIAR